MTDTAPMKLHVWGTRGSIPTPGATTLKYGGNTSCIEMRLDTNETIILDAGTGIRELGFHIMQHHPSPYEMHLLINHTHWDHIMGFPFFVPIYIPGYKVNIYGPVHYEKSLSEIFGAQMDYTYFPVSTAQLAATLEYKELKEETFKIGDAVITTRMMNHPVISLAYKIEYKGRVFIYTGDNEPYYNILGGGSDALGFDEDDDDALEMEDEVARQNEAVAAFCDGADVLFADCQYTEDEYTRFKSYGHSSTRHAVELAKKADVKKLVLFHHDPLQKDELVEAKLEEAKAIAKEINLNIEILAACEGMELDI